MLAAQESPEQRIARLEKRLQRERAARTQAEALAEEITRDLYERNRQLELLGAVSNVAIRQLPGEAIFNQCLAHVCQALEWDFARIVLLEPDAVASFSAASLGYDRSPDHDRQILHAAVSALLGDPDGVAGEAMRHQQICWVENVRSDHRFRGTSWCQLVSVQGLSSLVAVPIIIKDRLAALLVLAGATVHNADAVKHDLLAQLSIQLGQVIESELAQKHLIDARIAAESALRTKQEFLSVISHEMRTPMNAVLGMARLALDNPGNKSQLYLETILSSGERMMELVTMMLDMASLSAGSFKLEQMEFNLRDQLQSSVASFEHLATNKGLDFSILIEPSVPSRLLGDPVRIGQIISHVLGNAIKFTEQGKVEMTVSAKRHHDHATVTMTIQDTGVGIPEEKQATIFDVFSQADGSITRRHEGAGLGLALSAQILQRMHGHIVVDSVLGEGSLFTITIPFRVA